MEGQQDPSNFYRNLGKWRNIFSGSCWGNILAQRPPGHHTIHFPLTDPHKTPGATISSTQTFVWVPLLAEEVPQPSRNSQALGSKSQIWGSKSLSRCRHYQTESRGRHSKRSHMFQVMGKNTLGLPGLKPVWGVSIWKQSGRHLEAIRCNLGAI